MFISNFGGDPIKFKKKLETFKEVTPSSECDYN